MTFTHILLPLDGTAMAERVIPVARGLADARATRITLLHVLEHAAPARKHGELHLREASAAETYLRSLAERAFAGHAQIEWHTHDHGVRDLPASLAEHAQEFRPDLVVMCAHGNQWWRGWLRGNLAQRFLRHAVRKSGAEARVPILLVQPDARGRIVFPFRRILVPLDGSDAHEQGLDPMAKIATGLRIPVLLYTAIAPGASIRGRKGTITTLLPRTTEEVLRLAQAQAAAHLDVHVRELRAAGIEVAGRVAREEPASGIVRTAAEVNADLIVLGTHAWTATGALWATGVTSRVLQTAQTSFLLAPGSDG